MRDASDKTLQRELAVAAALRQVGTRVSPNPAERDRMRQRVLADFAVVCQGNSPVLPLRASRNRRSWLPDHAQGRLLVAAAAALCLLMSLSGMSVLLSRDALPGDPLYSFKRTAESAELGLTFGDQPKALKHLEFASARVDELQIMADQADAAGNWPAGQSKFLRALDDFDSDTTAGARLITGLALSAQANGLSGLRSWAAQQKVRLSAIRAALPLPISVRLDNTLGILDRVTARASALSNRSHCATIASGSRDDLGLLPDRSACHPSSVDVTPPPVSLPDVASTPVAIPPNLITPPVLLPPASANPVRLPGQKDDGSQPALPSTRSPGGVLSGPPGPGAKPPLPSAEPFPAQPWRPLPGHDSPPPATHLPPWILQPRLLPPG